MALRWFVLSTLSATALAATLYVNCQTGSDSTGDGSEGSPFLTLMRARDSVRSLQPLTSPVNVSISGDCYPRSQDGSALNYSEPVLFLSGVDSGTPAGPVTYLGTGARLLGGAHIPAAAWSSLPGRPGVFVANLTSLGLSKYGIGGLASGGLGTCKQNAMELFFNNSAAILARYPNLAPNGTWQWLNIASVVNSQTAFIVNGSAGARALTWANTPRIWVHGYWSFDWADSYVQIASITTAAKGTQVNVSPATPPVYGFLATARFYASNIFSELDAENEYFIDVDTGLLYFMPPGGDIASGEAFLSISNYGITTSSSSSVWDRVPRPLDISEGAAVRSTPVAGDAGVLSYVTFSGLAVKYARIAGILIESAVNVSIVDTESSWHGHNGAIVNGVNNIMRNVTVVGTGCEAISVSGGDETTLTPGNNYVSDSHVSEYARTIRTYNPGVGWGGVGNVYERNTLSTAPHVGMLGGGVSNIFRNNVFQTLCFEATDSGAWYAGRSWTRWGNVIANNTFENIRNREHMTLGSPSVQAIYLDDQLSGTVIANNTCANSQTCYFVGGGRDTVIGGNACGPGVDTCVHVDDRGLNWQAAECAYNATYTGDLVKGLFSVNYTHPPYSTAFPSIVDTLSRRPCTPVNISIVGNSYCNSTKKFVDASPASLASWGDLLQDNTMIASC